MNLLSLLSVSNWVCFNYGLNVTNMTFEQFNTIIDKYNAWYQDNYEGDVVLNPVFLEQFIKDYEGTC